MEYKDLVQAMSECNQEEAMGLISRYIQKGAGVKDLLDALTQGLKELGEKFSRGEAFIPELVFGGEIFNEAMKAMGPQMSKGGGAQIKAKGKVIMATVKGDLHDIGKNLVTTFLTVGGYQVIDLGTDVPNEKLIDIIQKEKPDVVGLSALLTTTMLGQRQFMAMLKEKGLRDKVKVMVGGAPVSQAWADEIGADGYGADAVDGKNKIDAMLHK
ncbi:MAG: cobalamin-dependent protein [Thermodesulfobacteriota bacterium]|jgi:5-methyltetrahydrofolate--homocysteine methyltransferase